MYCVKRQHMNTQVLILGKVWNVTQDNPGICLTQVYNDPGLTVSSVKYQPMYLILI